MSSPNEHESRSSTADKDVRSEAKDFGKSAKHAAHDAGDRVKEEFREFREEVVEEGTRLTSAAREEAYNFAEGRKVAAAEAMHDLARSVRDSSSAFEDRPNLQALFDSAAEGLDGFASSIEDRSFAQLYTDAEDIARRHPAAVAIGAGIVGMVIARIARSSGLRARLDEERHAAERRWAEREAAADQSRGGVSQ